LTIGIGRFLGAFPGRWFLVSVAAECSKAGIKKRARLSADTVAAARRSEGQGVAGNTFALADGVAANRPPPVGITTTDQLFKKVPRYGLMLLSSFSF
jgi:hypothetical protein